MADGSVKIDVGLNISKAEKDLARLKDKINKAEDALNADSNRKNAIEQQLGKAGAAADAAKQKVIELKQELASTRSRDEKASIRAELADATEEQRILTRESDRLNDEYVKVSASIEKGEKNLTAMKEEAGQLTQQIERARPGEAIARSLDSAKKSLWKFIKYAFGIRSVYILFQRLKAGIKSAVQEYAEYDKELKYNLALMKATKKAIQLQNGAALASIYNAILPIIQKIANWMLEAANAAAKFIAILSGKSSYKKAVVDTSEVAASLEDTSEAADDVTDSVKEAKKQLLGFDELNILSDDSGGSDKADKAKKEKPDKTDLDGVKMVDEAIDAFDDSFVSRLAASVKDVFFDWSDLNPEQIAKKAIAGLAALFTGASGFILGGVPGAIVGTLLGLTLGLVADSVLFDNDGKLSETEIKTLFKDGLNTITGGVIGFILGGPKGALLGATLGFDLTLLAQSIMPQLGDKGKNILGLIVDGLNYGLGGIAGAKLGFSLAKAGGVVGGPAGAAIGLGIGLSITFLIDNILTDGAKLNKLDEWIKGLAPINNEDFWGPILSKPLEVIYDKMLWAWEQIKLAYQGIIDFIRGVFTGEWTEALGGVKNIALWAFNELFGLPAQMATFVGENWTLIKLIIEEIKEKAQEFLDYLTSDFAGAITDFFGPILGAPIIEFYENTKSWWENDLKPIFDGIIKFLTGTFTGNWRKAWEGVKEIFRGIFSTLADIVKAPINNIISFINKVIRSINVLIDGANAIASKWGKGTISHIAEIPLLAKGGILKRGQIGLLEGSGDEAVVPLERNTDWMNTVADGLMERISQMRLHNNLASAFASTPLPAMAGGGIVPPNAVSGGGISRDDMQMAIERGVYNAIMALGGMPKSRGGMTIDVNGREFARAIYSDMQAVGNEHGISLIES